MIERRIRCNYMFHLKWVDFFVSIIDWSICIEVGDFKWKAILGICCCPSSWNCKSSISNFPITYLSWLRGTYEVSIGFAPLFWFVSSGMQSLQDYIISSCESWSASTTSKRSTSIVNMTWFEHSVWSWSRSNACHTIEAFDRVSSQQWTTGAMEMNDLGTFEMMFMRINKLSSQTDQCYLVKNK